MRHRPTLGVVVVGAYAHLALVHRGRLPLEGGDAMFIQIVAGDDRGVGEARSVQHLASLSGKRSQCTRIEPHADELMPELIMEELIPD